MPKREDVFYTLLKEIAVQMKDAADEYVSIMQGFPNTMAQIPRMKVHETTMDELVAKIHESLYTSFITPIDREDISDLALRMDDVVDLMEVVCARFDLFQIDHMRPEAVEMAELTRKAVIELNEVVVRLPKYKKDDKIMHHAKAISRIEDGADRVYPPAALRGGGQRQRGRNLASPVRPNGELPQRNRQGRRRGAIRGNEELVAVYGD